MNALLLTIALTVVAETPSWPAFLGDGATPLTAETIPSEWSPGSNVAWTAEIPGYGQSSPVIENGRIFVTSVEGEMKDTCHVLAFDLESGAPLWKHSMDSSEKVKSSVYVSRAAPTPVADQDQVIAFFESGDLVCLDHDGNEKWKRSLTKEYGPFENRFCLGASPAQDDEHIYILVDHDGPSYLLAIDKATGENKWKTDRSSRISWSSPAILPIDGKPQLVISSAGSVDGYDPQTGQQLWTTEDVGGNTTPTPRSVGDGLFLIGASSGARGETTEAAKQSNGLMRVTMNDGDVAVEKVWIAEKAISSFASPIVHEGFAYWVNRSGVVFCIDVETGEQKYAERLDESAWATPFAIGDRVYFFGRRGDTTVIAAGPEFKKLATNRLWEPEAEATDQPQRGNFGGDTQYGYAVIDGSLIVRTGGTLYCIREKSE